MIWEDTVENAIVALLQLTTSITTIRRGMQDENPNMTLPALVVHAQVQERSARHDVYKLLVTIEYKSIPEENSVVGIESAMQQVDTAITKQPSAANQALIPTGGAGFIGWQGVIRTQQEIHTDRRTNIRELEVTLAMNPNP